MRTTFVYERLLDGLAIYDLRRGYVSPIAVVYGGDYLDTILMALERAHGRTKPYDVVQAPAADRPPRLPSTPAAGR